MRAACDYAGLDSRGAELIRLAENAIYRLPASVVARVSRPGQLRVARKEVAVSDWLRLRDFPVVGVRGDLPNPVSIGDRAVTFWEELPPHVAGSPADIGRLLRRLHAMSPDGINLPATDPFVQIEARIDSLAFLAAADRDWMLARSARLRREYGRALPAAATGLVHGDPWSGNVVRTADGPVLLDLERFSVGPPEYDLTVVAASHTSYGLLAAPDYEGLVAAYGRDVTRWDGYPLLRDIRELRVTT
ncbi:MAG: aminoglycoside phosphotransferase family protein, partial [Nocardioides sp.]